MFSNNFLDCRLSNSSKTRSPAIHADGFTFLKKLVDGNKLDVNCDSGNYGMIYYGTSIMQAAIQNKVDCFRYHMVPAFLISMAEEQQVGCFFQFTAKYGLLEILQYLLEECESKTNTI